MVPVASSSQEHGTAFVMLDGIGDVNIPDLGSMTPLKAARTPTMDAIAGACCHASAPYHLREMTGGPFSLKGSHLVQVRD